MPTTPISIEPAQWPAPQSPAMPSVLRSLQPRSRPIGDERQVVVGPGERVNDPDRDGARQ